jgi:hypothetical protein
MEPYSSLPYSSAEYFDGPPDDVHSKRLAETPRYSKIKAMTDFQSAFGTSKKLQQVFGITGPEPYVRPPPIPQDLEQRFLKSLQEYSADRQSLSGDPSETLSHVASDKRKMSADVRSGKTQLENIVEEKESPVRATHKNPGSGGRPAGLIINPPVWDSGYEAVSGAENISTNDQQDTSLDTLHAFGLDSKQTSVCMNDGRSTNYGDNCVGYAFPQGSSSLANLTKHRSHLSSEQQPLISFDDTLFNPRHAIDLSLSGGSPSPVLFPSPRIEQEESWKSTQTDNGGAAPLGFTTSAGLYDQGVYIGEQFAAYSQEIRVPQIMVQAPSPGKMPPSTTKKRPATSQGVSPPRVRISEATCGLPMLDADLEMLWKVKFPGNTYALLTIMLPWSLTMRHLYNQIGNPYNFSINAAFPYPVKPPVYQKLVSVSFYDTSCTPHKEIRFISPDDCAEMSYNEVDVFSYPKDTADAIEPQCRIDALKRALGVNAGSGAASYKHMPMHQRATIGEGRWSYILLQSPRPSDSSLQAAHIMIAWPTCSVTDSSECLHTIGPDAYNVSHPCSFAPKRATSLQNLAASMRLQQNLRAASSEQLPKIAEEVEGALTLKRRVVKMEKVGKLPLIEGYRIDVRKWEEWIKAVGMGKGKVMLWMER